MAKNAMPVSKATNAYELLDEIATLIVEEPKRYNQRDWKEQIERVERSLLPACQTVCCIAGWVDTLRNPAPFKAADIVVSGIDWDAGDFGAVGNFAKGVLGLSDEQARQLFDGGAAGGRSDDYDEDWADDVGEVTEDSIREHAIRGVAHIHAFMSDHEAQLKAKKV